MLYSAGWQRLGHPVNGVRSGKVLGSLPAGARRGAWHRGVRLRRLAPHGAALLRQPSQAGAVRGRGELPPLFHDLTSLAKAPPAEGLGLLNLF